MSKTPPFESIEALLAKGQQLMIEFLKNDLALAFTFLELAETYRDSDPSHAAENIGKAKTAVATIRTFEGRIQDPETWSEIHNGSTRLESEIRRVESGKADGL